MFQRRGAAFVSLTLAPALAAQSNPTMAKDAEISGVVTDVGSRRAAEKVWVCAYTPPRASLSSQPCVRVDSTGSYKLDHIPLSTIAIAVVCERLRGFGKTVASDTIVVADAGSLRKDWSVQRQGCDTRPIRRLTGVFRGHYTGGFEESEFVPCPQDAWFVPSDSLDLYPYDARRAWAEFPRGIEVNWPQKVPHNSWGSARYYVEWRGTVTGPASYGHMGVSAFEFRVDSVLKVRAPRRGDCR